MRDIWAENWNVPQRLGCVATLHLIDHNHMIST